MSDLKRKIRQLEVDIAADKKTLNDSKDLLVERVLSPQTMTIALLGGFAIGFLMEHHKTKEVVGRAISKAPNIMSNLQSILSILSI